MLTTAAVVAATITAGAGAAEAGQYIRAIPRGNPVGWTPRVVDDAVVTEAGVRELRQVGQTMYVAGHFNSVRNATRTQTYTRTNLFSFNANTGAVTDWAPVVPKQVSALEATRDGRYLYIGGAFAHFDDQTVNGLVKYDLVNKKVDTTFHFPVKVAQVTDLKLARGRLFVAGTFPGGIVAVNPTTGATTRYFSRTQAKGTEKGWTTRIYRFSVNPGATKMVVVGSFTSIGGQPRQQAAMIQLGRSSARLSGWSSPRWRLDCSSEFHWYTRDVDWSPKGKAFAIVTAGGAAPRTAKLCDTVTWWRAIDKGRQQPVWVNHTGGDTIQTVTTTDRAVFVSGHFRWLNNRLGRSRKGPGAVDRRGLGAISIKTGKATRWNPTKSIEGGMGGFDLLFTKRGLWVGHYERFLGRNARGPEVHEGLGLLPY